VNSVQTSAEVDAFTAEVIRSAVVAITTEMKTNLMRTAYNQIIYEAEDFTVGLFDADGNTISIGLGLPMFIRGLSDAIKAKLAHYGKENIHLGDILLMTGLGGRDGRLHRDRDLRGRPLGDRRPRCRYHPD